jgi:hypothetical protein
MTLRNSYQDGAAFITTFAPKKQYAFCAMEKRCYMGKAPNLVTVNEAFGKGTAQSWLAFQLRDLSEFSGAKEKLGIGQIDDITEVIMSQFPFLKVTELMHFFLLFKSGKFGKFYGAVDGLAIMEALREFINDRNDKLYRWRQEEERREKEAKEAEEAQRFEALKQRYISRVPGAFTDKAPIDFLQYRMMGFDHMDDDCLKKEIEAIKSGAKRLPTELLEMIRNAFKIKD